ncbi:hypothetical protein H5410_040119, partial [Solanum commersonii]
MPTPSFLYCFLFAEDFCFSPTTYAGTSSWFKRPLFLSLSTLLSTSQLFNGESIYSLLFSGSMQPLNFCLKVCSTFVFVSDDLHSLFCVNDRK